MVGASSRDAIPTAFGSASVYQRLSVCPRAFYASGSPAHLRCRVWLYTSLPGPHIRWCFCSMLGESIVWTMSRICAVCSPHLGFRLGGSVVPIFRPLNSAGGSWERGWSTSVSSANPCNQGLLSEWKTGYILC